MIEDYLKLPLPFYDSVEKQVYKRTGSLSDLDTVKLVTPKNFIVPFQIKRKTRANEVTTFELYHTDGTLYIDLTSIVPTSNLYIKTLTGSGNDYICYENFTELTSDIVCNQYYIKISDSVETWYSDILTVYDFEFDFGGEIGIGTGGIEINPSEVIGWIK